MKTVREVAAAALLRVESGGYSTLVFDSALSKSGLDARDQALAAALFYGVLERKLTLDHCIGRYARPKLTETVRAILRLAFYQLLYLDTIPPHAAVSEAVAMTRTMGQGAASGLVNGVLRSFLRDGCRIPPVKGTLYQRMEVEFSCPAAWCERFCARYGEEKTREFLARSFGRPPVFLRANPLKATEEGLLSALSAEGYQAGRCEGVPGAWRTAGGLAHSRAYGVGLFLIEDLSAQQAALLCGAQPGDRVLDVCAAPGGKSFLMAAQMENRGEIVACDLSEKRLRLIESGARRLGITVIRTARNDGTKPNEAFGRFDRVLCDVPCSGLGVLRRKPEVKYRGPEASKDLPETQYKILETSSHYCKAGGVLVYSTCTIRPEENEEITGRFLARHTGFEPVLWNGDRFDRTILPGEEGGDGFYLAKMRRRG